METFMPNDFYQVSLKAILKNVEGSVLVLKADFEGPLSGYYDLPGGRIDESEFEIPLLDILKSEIREEIRIDNVAVHEVPVAVGRHRIPKDIADTEKDLHLLYLFFEGELSDGDIRISDEHTGFEWVHITPENVGTYFTSGLLEGMRTYMVSKE